MPKLFKVPYLKELIDQLQVRSVVRLGKVNVAREYFRQAKLEKLREIQRLSRELPDSGKLASFADEEFSSKNLKSPDIDTITVNFLMGLEGPLKIIISTLSELDQKRAHEILKRPLNFDKLENFTKAFRGEEIRKLDELIKVARPGLSDMRVWQKKEDQHFAYSKRGFAPRLQRYQSNLEGLEKESNLSQEDITQQEDAIEEGLLKIKEELDELRSDIENIEVENLEGDSKRFWEQAELLEQLSAHFLNEYPEDEQGNLILGRADDVGEYFRRFEVVLEAELNYLATGSDAEYLQAAYELDQAGRQVLQVKQDTEGREGAAVKAKRTEAKGAEVKAGQKLKTISQRYPFDDFPRLEALSTRYIEMANNVKKFQEVNGKVQAFKDAENNYDQAREKFNQEQIGKAQLKDAAEHLKTARQAAVAELAKNRGWFRGSETLSGKLIWLQVEGILHGDIDHRLSESRLPDRWDHLKEKLTELSDTFLEQGGQALSTFTENFALLYESSDEQLGIVNSRDNLPSGMRTFASFVTDLRAQTSGQYQSEQLQALNTQARQLSYISKFKNSFVQAVLVEHFEHIPSGKIDTADIEVQAAIRRISRLEGNNESLTHDLRKVGWEDEEAIEDIVERIDRQRRHREQQLSKLENPIIQDILRKDPTLVIVDKPDDPEKLSEIRKKIGITEINDVMRSPSVTVNGFIELLNEKGIVFSAQSTARVRLGQELSRLQNIRHIYNEELRKYLQSNPNLSITTDKDGITPAAQEAIRNINRLCDLSTRELRLLDEGQSIDLGPGLGTLDRQGINRSLERALRRAVGGSSVNVNFDKVYDGIRAERVFNDAGLDKRERKKGDVPLSGYKKIGGKQGGANQPGQYGGVYQHSKTGRRVLLKQEVTTTKNPFVRLANAVRGISPKQTIHHEKIIAEVVAGNIIEELIGDKAAKVYLVRHPNDEVPYICSVIIEGNFQDLYKDVYKQAGLTAPKDRPRNLGSINKYPFHTVMSQNRYEDFGDALAASLLVGDFDVHAANLGVVTVIVDNKPKQVLRRYDYAAGTEKLDDEVHPHSRLRHLPGVGPTNHFREYPRSLKITMDFVNALKNVSNHDLGKIKTRVGRTLDHIHDVYSKNPIDALKAFRAYAKWIGMLKAAYAKADTDILVTSIKDFLYTKMEKRLKSLKNFALEIEIDVAINEYEESGRKDDSHLRRLIQENPEYFKKGKFHFRDTEHTGGKVIYSRPEWVGKMLHYSGPFKLIVFPLYALGSIGVSGILTPFLLLSYLIPNRLGGERFNNWVKSIIPYNIVNAVDSFFGWIGRRLKGFPAITSEGKNTKLIMDKVKEVEKSQQAKPVEVEMMTPKGIPVEPPGEKATLSVKVEIDPAIEAVDKSPVTHENRDRWKQVQTDEWQYKHENGLHFELYTKKDPEFSYQRDRQTGDTSAEKEAELIERLTEEAADYYSKLPADQPLELQIVGLDNNARQVFEARFKEKMDARLGGDRTYTVKQAPEQKRDQEREVKNSLPDSQERKGLER